MDAQRLKANFAEVGQYGDEVALFFYADLFLRDETLRGLFPISMVRQRDRLLTALGSIVSQVDDLEELTPFVQQLGRDHRKYGITAEHYPLVGASLLATLRHFSGESWSPELEADWTAAYGLVSQVMLEAAEEAAATSPPWWNAEIIEIDRRRFDITVMRVRTDRPLPYTPGEAVALETPLRPRMWRHYSVACAPRDDRILEFHIKRVAGGPVSTVLTGRVEVGDWLKLGAPMGTLTLPPESSRLSRDLLMLAGGTGLAPFKALIEQLAAAPEPKPQVHLYFGARTEDGLYDLDHLERMAEKHPWLTVVPAVSDEADDYRGRAVRGTVAELALRHGTWDNHEVLVCGPPAMVRPTVEQLTAHGVSAGRIHLESAWSQS